MTNSFSPVADILYYLYLTISGKYWLVIYLALFLLNYTLSSITLHIMALGASICIPAVLAALKLPSPDRDLVKKVLGDAMEIQDQENPAWRVAHRAACLDGPENSLEAVRLAAKNGAKWVEFDVSFTSDHFAIAFHDDTLDRVTTASGPVNSFTSSQLSKLDLATKHPLSASFNNVRIPSVEEFVAECVKLDLKMIIDLKTWELPEETVNLILSLHKQFPTLKTNSIITSFYPKLLYKLRSSDPSIVTAVSTQPYFLSFSVWKGVSCGLKCRFTGIKQCVAMLVDILYTPLLEQVLWWIIGISAVLVHKAVITREYVDNWRRKGVRVMAWTVNCPIEKQFLTEVIGVQVLTDTLEN